jgi:hypothetical protein
MLGPALPILLFSDQSLGFRSVVEAAALPSLLGGAAGFMIGCDLQRELPTLPGAELVADAIRSSPLGTWLGWQQRRAAS